jgi:hypothetical protein
MDSKFEWRTRHGLTRPSRHETGALGPPVTTLEIPAEVDLGADDPITVKGEDLRIATSTSVAPPGSVAHR